MLGFALSKGKRVPPIPPGITSRYWRIYITATQNSDGYLNCCLIGFNNAVGDQTNQAASLASPVINQSSIYYGGYEAKWAITNSLETGALYPNGGNNFWHSNYQSTPFWASLDCGAGVSITVSEIAISGCNVAGRQPSAFQVQTSADGTNWTTVATYTGVSGWTTTTPKFFNLLDGTWH